MKIKTRELDYESVLKIEPPKHKDPKIPPRFFRFLMKTLGTADLKETNFKYHISAGVDLDSPALILMNHSSFIDLEIVSNVFYPHPFSIVCTSDGFVGKEWLMRNLGCIPTQKFVPDITLIEDIRYSLHKLGISVLMYPEASYTFDGCATPLQRRLGLLLKKLDVPVIMIKTSGAFARDPLYNMLQKRKADVSAEIYNLVTLDEVRSLSVSELDARLDEAFTFDNFRWQRDNGIIIDEPFRADGLQRILYKCPVCGSESGMIGQGVSLDCKNCGHHWELDVHGALISDGGVFDHIPDWYAWEREQVRTSIIDGSYCLDCGCRIGIMADYSAIYMVGEGHLHHDLEGFTLTGCDGRLCYRRKPNVCYGLYSDYYWYELGDIICIGDAERLYYTFPQNCDVVAKTRLAVEEMYKLRRRTAEPKRPENRTPEQANQNNI